MAAFSVECQRTEHGLNRPPYRELFVLLVRFDEVDVGRQAEGSTDEDHEKNITK